MILKGSSLNSRQREQVLAAFVHRNTIENAKRRGVDCVNCAMNRYPYVTGQALPDGPHVYTREQWHTYHTTHGAVAISDAQWLADHAFKFIKDGSRLAIRGSALPAYMAEAV